MDEGTRRKRTSQPASGKPASRLIDQRIRDLGGWRGETLARKRLVKAAVALNESAAKSRRKR